MIFMHVMCNDVGRKAQADNTTYLVTAEFFVVSRLLASC